MNKYTAAILSIELSNSVIFNLAYVTHFPGENTHF